MYEIFVVNNVSRIKVFRLLYGLTVMCLCISLLPRLLAQGPKNSVSLVYSAMFMLTLCFIFHIKKTFFPGQMWQKLFGAWKFFFLCMYIYLYTHTHTLG